MKWRGWGGWRQGERELGESREVLSAGKEGWEPRKGGFRAEEEGYRKATRLAGLGTAPHLGLGGGLLGVHILPRLWLGSESQEAGHQCLRQRSQRTAVSPI